MSSNVQNFLREFDELMKKYNITEIIPVYNQDYNEHFIEFFSNGMSLTFDEYCCGKFNRVKFKMGDVTFE